MDKGEKAFIDGLEKGYITVNHLRIEGRNPERDRTILIGHMDDLPCLFIFLAQFPDPSDW